MPRPSTAPAVIALLAAAAGLAAAPGARAQLQWSAVSLHPPGALSSIASDGSPGQVVGTANAPFRWDISGGTPVGTSLLPAGLLAGSALVALAGAQFGQAVTFASPAPGSNYAAAWAGSASSITSLQIPGYDTTAVRGGGSLPDGTFELVGTGTPAGGVARPVAWTWPGRQSRLLPLLPGVAPDRHFAFAAGGGFQGGYYVNANQNTRGLVWRPGASSPSEVGGERSVVRGIGFGWAVGSTPDAEGVVKPTVWDLSAPALNGYFLSSPAGPGSVGDFADVYASPATDTLLAGSATPVGGAQRALLVRIRGIELLEIVNLPAPLQGNWGNARANAIWADGALLRVCGQAFNNDAQRFEAILWTAANPNCYPNCDGSTNAPALNALDFSCFLQRYRAGDTYANCDGSTTVPQLNALDFSCFLGRYRAGCP